MKRAYLLYLFVFLLGILTVLMFAYSNNKFAINTNSETKTDTPATEVKEDPVVLKKTTETGLQVSDQYLVKVFARDLGKVKVLQSDRLGNLYASISDQGKIVAFKDANVDGVADLSVTLIKDLNQPNGIQILCLSELVCDLYIAESDSVSLYRLDPKALTAEFNRKLFDLPLDGLNELRSLKIVMIGGKQMLMVGVGSSCNVCDEKEKKRAAVLVSSLDGTAQKIYSNGLRNPSSILQNQVTGEIYVTEIGRDWLGDNLPAEELNILAENAFFGWPYCYGDNEIDVSFNNTQKGEDMCAMATVPAISLPAHSQPTGMAIGSISTQGATNLFIALHGSWNRSEPSGYKIVRYEIGKDGKLGTNPSDFITGFIQDGEIKYRPTDIFILNGSFYFTDDHSGKIFLVKENSK